VADGSKIEWTDATWNPLVGCTAVSAGCDNCYAEGEVNRRHAAALSPKTSPKMLEAFPARFDSVSIRPDRFLLQPLHWPEARKVFVNSLSDLFHADVPDEFIARVFAVMAATPRHTYQLLTKRHARMRSLLNSPAWRYQLTVAHHNLLSSNIEAYRSGALPASWTWPLPNVWLGVSVEDQRWADLRIPALLATPAAVRWISAEPLLGSLSVDTYLRGGLAAASAGASLGWVVVGGESGANARPMHPEWPRRLRDQCLETGTPFLFKQHGEWRSPLDSDGPWDTGRGRAQPLPAFLVADRDEPGVGAGTVHCHRGAAGSNPAVVVRVGKKKAGRELDGRLHDGYPEAAHG